MHITINHEGIAALDRILDFAHEMSDFLDSDELDAETFETLHESISFVPDTKEELRDKAAFWAAVEDKWGGIPSVQAWRPC